VLIQWSNSDEALSTWEDEEALRARFPDAPAWGQAGFQQRGNVSSAPVTANEGSGEGEEQLASEAEAKGRFKPRPSEDVSGGQVFGFLELSGWCNGL
jgi:hypothetical protein